MRQKKVNDGKCFICTQNRFKRGADMTAKIIAAMGISLVLTILFELLFALLMGVRGNGLRVNILCNILTNPLVTSIYYFCKYGLMLHGAVMIIITAALEISAVITEWRVYKACTDIKKPLLFSIGANCFSYFIGLFL